MRSFFTALLTGFTLAAVAAPPTTKPATQPVSRPATKPVAQPKQRFSLMNGAVKFVVPAGWTESEKSDDGKTAHYNSPDGLTTIAIGVVPQEYPIPLHNDNLKEQMKTFVINGLREEFKKHNQEILYGPKSETDDRFYLRIHARIKDGHETLDQLHIYRAAGLDLLMFTVVVKTDKKDEAAAGHTAGEDIALSTVLGPADKKPAGK